MQRPFRTIFIENIQYDFRLTKNVFGSYCMEWKITWLSCSKITMLTQKNLSQMNKSLIREMLRCFSSPLGKQFICIFLTMVMWVIHILTE